MTISKIEKANIIAAVPDRWEAQYSGTHWESKPDKMAIKQKLFDLREGNRLTVANVDRVIGNTSWTECRCDNCDEDCEALANITDECGERHVDICKSCLEKALATLK
jgi:hypothetical protein